MRILNTYTALALLTLVIAFDPQHSFSFQKSSGSRTAKPSITRSSSETKAPEKFALTGWNPTILERDQGDVTVELLGTFPDNAKVESEQIKVLRSRRTTAGLLVELDSDSFTVVDQEAQLRVTTADRRDEIGRATFYIDNRVCATSSDLRPANATATATIKDGKLASVTIDEHGSDYVGQPSISVESPHTPPQKDDQPATAHATVLDGKVDSIAIDDHGKGYTSPPSVTISREASARAHIAGQRLSSISLTNPGSGYTEPPFITVAAPHKSPLADDVTAVVHALLNGNGTIRNIVVDDAGANYESTPEVVISRSQRFPEYDQCRANTPDPGSGHHFLAINAASKAARLDSLSICQTPATESLLNKQNLLLSSNNDVTFVVCNKNPFRYKYLFSHDASQIENDDLSVFLGALNPAGAASKAADTAASQTTNTVKGSQNKAGAQGISTMLKEEFTFESRNPSEPAFAAAASDSYAACVTHVENDLREIESEYEAFIPVYESLATQVRDDPSLTCKNRVAKARVLFNRSIEFAWTTNLNKLSQEVIHYQAVGDKRTKAIDSISGNSLASSHKGIYQAIEGGLSTDNCIVKNATQSLVANVSKSVVQPLRDILGNPNAFTFTSQSYEYADPTKIHWSLGVQSKPSEQQLGSLAVSSGQDFSGCFSNSSATPKQDGGNQNGNSTKDKTSTPVDNQSDSADLIVVPKTELGRTASPFKWAVFRTSQDDSSSSPTKSKGSGSDGGAQGQDQSNKPAAAPADTHEIHSGDIMLGAPRFLASTGLAIIDLRKQEFQQVAANPATSGTSGTNSGSTGATGSSSSSTTSFVAYKSNSLARISPMIFAHVRLGPDRYARSTFDRSRDWWMTFGITGQSDSKGVSPEYMVGFSHGFWDDWSLITAGAYFGQKQRPVSGYEVGKTLPSGFSGDIPVERNYKVGVGIALSFRIPGTSAPKTKSSTNQSNSSDTSGGE